MRTTRPTAIRPVRWFRHGVMVGFSVVLLMISTLATLGTAHASGGPSNTRADLWGTPEVPASSWLPSLGGGVTIYSNGPHVAYTPDKPNNTVNGVVSGEEWQCVELVNRLYLTKGWIASTWNGNGAQMYGKAPLNLKKEANGSITYLNPGDVIAFGGGYGGFGHVAVVNTVTGSTVQIASQNTNNVFDSSLRLNNGILTSPSWTGVAGYIIQGVIHHPLDKSQPAFYANKIVQWDGDHKPQMTSWLVTPDLKRHWIPDISTFYCLEGLGYAFAGPIPSYILDQLPDQTGNWAKCASAVPTAPVSVTLTPTPTPVPISPTSTPTPTPTPTPTATPAPQLPTTWTEQEGDYGANSFSDPHNASGMGPHLGAMSYVQVSCKLYDPYITSVNPDGYWYRIASAPWNNQYYIAANTFWNGDIPGQTPYTHNTDWNVANC